MIKGLVIARAPHLLDQFGIEHLPARAGDREGGTGISARLALDGVGMVGHLAGASLSCGWRE